MPGATQLSFRPQVLHVGSEDNKVPFSFGISHDSLSKKISIRLIINKMNKWLFGSQEIGKHVQLVIIKLTNFSLRFERKFSVDLFSPDMSTADRV